MSKQRQTQFGIAMRNFTKYPEMPSAAELIEYGVRMEDLGYEVLCGRGTTFCLASSRIFRSTRR